MQELSKLIFAVVALSISTFGSWAEDFKFQDFSNLKDSEKAAQEKLLQIHPVGTAVENIEKTLLEAGANKVSLTKTDKFLRYHYDTKYRILWFYRWSVTVYKDGQNQIKDISVKRMYMGV